MSYIIKHKRTPILSYLKNFVILTPVELGSIIVNDLIKDINKEDIDIAYIGNVLSAGNGQNIARQITYNCKINCTSITVNRICSSGMTAIIEGHKSILLGESDLVLVGGTESMSNTPHLLYKKKITKYGDVILIDSMLIDGLIDPFSNETMVEQSEKLLKTYNITRKEIDDSAKESYIKSRYAHNNNFFKNEILPINNIDYDQEIFKCSDLNKIYSNKSLYPNGLLTPANVSKLSDGASFMLLASKNYIVKNNISPICEIFGYYNYVDKPLNSSICFINCIKNICDKYKINISNIDTFEINEAFSYMSIFANKYLKIPKDKINEFGSSISMGHPIGASGSRIVNTLISVLQIKNKNIGCATVCNGCGGSSSLLIKKI